jgi:hypothetical protein
MSGPIEGIAVYTPPIPLVAEGDGLILWCDGAKSHPEMDGNGSPSPADPMVNRVCSDPSGGSDVGGRASKIGLDGRGQKGRVNPFSRHRWVGDSFPGLRLWRSPSGRRFQFQS